MRESFADFCEKQDREREEAVQHERNSTCEYSKGRYRKRDCHVVKIDAYEDRCKTCGKVFLY